MKNLSVFILLSVFLFSFSSCQAIADIFKAGVWVGILVVVVIVGLVLWLIGKGKS